MLTAIRGRKGGPSWSGTLDCMAAHIGLGKSILSLPPFPSATRGEGRAPLPPPFFPFPSLVPQGNKEKEKRAKARLFFSCKKNFVEDYFFLELGFFYCDLMNISGD